MPQFGYSGVEVRRFGCPGDTGEETGTFEWAELTHKDDPPEFYTVDGAGNLASKTEEEIAAIKQSSAIESALTAGEAALDVKIDELAQSWRYINMDRMTSYIGDPNPQWDAEGRAGQKYRSDVYVWAIEQRAIILADPTKMPETVEAFVAMMPAPPERPVVS